MNSKKKEKRKHLKDAAREIPDRYWGKKKKKKVYQTLEETVESSSLKKPNNN